MPFFNIDSIWLFTCLEISSPQVKLLNEIVYEIMDSDRIHYRLMLQEIYTIHLKKFVF
jgi:hypothetical protein